MIELPVKAGMIKPDEILSTEEAKVRIEKRNLQIAVEEAWEHEVRRQQRPRQYERTWPSSWTTVNTNQSSWTASFNFGASGR